MIVGRRSESNVDTAIDRDLLFVIAEISVAITGFAGIAAAIGKPTTVLQKWHVRSVVDAGAWAVVLSLLPAFVTLLNVSEQTVWRVSSGVLLLVIVGYYLLNRESLKVVAEGIFVRVFAVGDLCALVLSAANAAGLTGRYYEAGYMYVLYWFLIQALVFFFLSIQDLWAKPN
jgi:hypothetical protein